MSLSFDSISDNIKQKLLSKLSSSRNIINEEMFFINEQHKLLCSYYKKIY